MRFVILGCGRVGAMLAQLLVAESHDVTVIDQNSEAFSRLSQDFPQEKTVLGDGTDEDVLKRAGLASADAFVAVTNGDNRNILASEIAQHTFGVPKVMCRIYDPIRQETYNAMGLESICPTIVGAKLFRDALLNPFARQTSPTASLAQGTSVPLTRLDRSQPRPQ
ncbi:MAG: potassium channel family protein [Ktedonobacterales bacterium]